MSELIFNNVFQEISTMFKGQTFSTMYFGRHFGKNLLILMHDITVMIVLEENYQCFTPKFIKTVSFRGERRKGCQIVGSGNVILLLDENGLLWRLINAFEISNEQNECLESLNQKCFYEWIPFSKFNFVKVLALSAMEDGFACLGIYENSMKKLLILPSIDSSVEDYTFEELNSTISTSFYLTNLTTSILRFINTSYSPVKETLLVTDNFTGKSYLCAESGKSSLINISNNILISVLHFQQENYFLLCFESGKLLFFPCKGLIDIKKQFVCYLSKKIVVIKRCCCLNPCLLWSDGVNLCHTRLIFHSDFVKLSHLYLKSTIQSPVFVLQINQSALVVTVNNFYYSVKSGVSFADEIKKHPQELLSEICEGSYFVENLKKKTDRLAHYLCCKDIIQKGKVKENTEIRWEGDNIIIRSDLGISLSEELWRLRLTTSQLDKNFVHMIDLESDLSKKMFIAIKNPFKSKCKVKVSLVGSFDEKNLFLYLGEVDECETNMESEQLIRIIQKKKRSVKKLE